ncbi:hypothetical protein FB451DRAFT_1552400 [Mycena latifolia]|nr:hypothetical protein FB451DRAFT_1552400 [Mycena latifolia]
MIPAIGARSLKVARIYWEHDEPNDVEAIIVALRSMTQRDVPFICSHINCEDDFEEILDSISRLIPHTQTLDINVMTLGEKRDGMLAHFITYLPRFTDLVFLSMTLPSVTNMFFNWDKAVDAEDKITVQGLAEACMTLQACCLGYRRAWRKANGTWQSYPSTEFKTQAGLDWGEAPLDSHSFFRR